MYVPRIIQTLEIPIVYFSTKKDGIQIGTPHMQII